MVGRYIADLDVAAGEGDADLVDLGRVERRGLLGVLERHFDPGCDGLNWGLIR